MAILLCHLFLDSLPYRFLVFSTPNHYCYNVILVSLILFRKWTHFDQINVKSFRNDFFISRKKNDLAVYWLPMPITVLVHYFASTLYLLAYRLLVPILKLVFFVCVQAHYWIITISVQCHLPQNFFFFWATFV